MPKIRIEKEVPDNDCASCGSFFVGNCEWCNEFNKRLIPKKQKGVWKVKRCPACIAATVKE